MDIRMSSTGNSINGSSTEEMTPQKAIEILIQAVFVGQKRGAWNLEEVPILLKAVQHFTKQPNSS